MARNKFTLGKHRRRSARSYRLRKQTAYMFYRSNTYMKFNPFLYGLKFEIGGEKKWQYL